MRWIDYQLLPTQGADSALPCDWDALVKPAQTMAPDQAFLHATRGMLIASTPEDTQCALDPHAHTWVEADAGSAPLLQVALRSIRILHKGVRTYVEAPDHLQDAAQSALLDYARFQRMLEDMSARASELARQVLLQERGALVPDPAAMQAVQQSLASASQGVLQVHALRPYADMPALIGRASLASRLRTELLCQIQLSDQLDLLEDRFEWAHDAMQGLLQLRQEAVVGQREFRVGQAILALLLIDMVFSIWNRFFA